MIVSTRTLLFIAALSGAFAVFMGAFGAHALRGQLPEALFDAYRTGVNYQFYHTFALGLAAVLLGRAEEHSTAAVTRLLKGSGLLFVLGIILFSGSLYILALGGPKSIGMITPIGGLCFILGWMVMAVTVLKV